MATTNTSNTIKMQELPESNNLEDFKIVGVDKNGKSVRLPASKLPTKEELATIGSKVGELSNLQTTAKDKIVNAINELANNSIDAYTKTESDAKYAKSSDIESLVGETIKNEVFSKGNFANVTDIETIFAYNSAKTLITANSGYVKCESNASNIVTIKADIPFSEGHKYALIIDMHSASSVNFMAGFATYASNGNVIEYKSRSKSRSGVAIETFSTISGTNISYLRPYFQFFSQTVEINSISVYDLGDSSSSYYALTDNEIIAKYDANTYKSYLAVTAGVAQRVDTIDASVTSMSNRVDTLNNKVDKTITPSIVVTNILTNGKCDSVDDIVIPSSLTNRHKELTSDGGLRIYGTGASAYLKLGDLGSKKVIGHRYVFLFDVKHSSTTLVVWNGDTSSHDSKTFSGIPQNTRTLLSWSMTAQYANTKLYAQLYESAELIFYGLICVDCGVEGDDLYNKDLAYFEDLYKKNGYFDVYTPAEYALSADSASSLRDTDDNYNYVKNKSRLTDFANKKWLMVGDSITNLGFANIASGTSYYDGWVYLAAKELGLNFTSFVNKGIGGNRLSYTPTGGVVNGDPMVKRIDTYATYNPDVIVVMGGSNDIGSSVAMGSSEEPFDENTIFGSVGSIARKVRATYPNALLVFGIPPRREGTEWDLSWNSIYKISPTIKSACDYFGVPYVDFFNKSGINLRYIKSNPNLLDGVSFTEGKAVDSSGNVIDGNFFVSDKFEIIAGHRYYTSDGYIHWYNGDTYLGAVRLYANAGNNSLAPEGATHARFRRETIGSGTIDGSVVSLRFADNLGDKISDGVHPNAVGNKAMAKLFAQEMKKYVFDI